ncbi:MAG: hypothetical protein WC756_12095 [Taibaiella sp.]|jgi:hypothetical protein
MIIDIHHPTGYVTKVEIDLSEFETINNFDSRVKKRIEMVNGVVDRINRKNGTKIFLKIKSKANTNEY